MVEWQVAALVLSVVSPLVVVIVTYVKTWSKLEITLDSLNKTIDKLTTVVDGIKDEQADILQRVSKVETTVRMLEHAVNKVCER
jgi:uncharacterized protein YoxC